MTASYSDLKGKVVLVTGSSKALGAETARAFARSGSKIVVNGRDEQAIGRIVGEIQADGGECLGITADVTSATDLTRTADVHLRTFRNTRRAGCIRRRNGESHSRPRYHRGAMAHNPRFRS